MHALMKRLANTMSIRFFYFYVLQCYGFGRKCRKSIAFLCFHDQMFHPGEWYSQWHLQLYHGITLTEASLSITIHGSHGGFEQDVGKSGVKWSFEWFPISFSPVKHTTFTKQTCFDFVILKAFLCFEVVSRLKINLSKSKLVLVGAITNVEQLASNLICCVSSLPVKYLGQPFTTHFKARHISNQLTLCVYVFYLISFNPFSSSLLLSNMFFIQYFVFLLFL